MESITVAQIAERLSKLPADKLAVVYDFVSYLAERQAGLTLREAKAESYQTMLASESVLRRDWDRREEDAAWADL